MYLNHIPKNKGHIMGGKSWLTVCRLPNAEYFNAAHQNCLFKTPILGAEYRT